MRKHVNEGRVRAEDLLIFKVAYDLCDRLIQETLETQILLHGDIHHFNILYSDERGWLAIDPKGIKGPRVLSMRTKKSSQTPIVWIGRHQ